MHVLIYIYIYVYDICMIIQLNNNKYNIIGLFNINTSIIQYNTIFIYMNILVYVVYYVICIYISMYL